MIISLKRHFAYIGIVLCGLLAIMSSTVAKPSLSFSFAETFPSFAAITHDYVERKNAGQMKSYRWALNNTMDLFVFFVFDERHMDWSKGIRRLRASIFLIFFFLSKFYDLMNGTVFAYVQYT